jgi:hypothetical protein
MLRCRSRHAPRSVLLLICRSPRMGTGDCWVVTVPNGIGRLRFGGWNDQAGEAGRMTPDSATSPRYRLRAKIISHEV